MKFRSLTLGIGVLVPTAIVARAEVYLKDEEAPGIIFPDKKFTRREITLSPDLIEKIEKASGETVRNSKLLAFIGPKKEVVFIDKVVGKHESITLAVGLSETGEICGIEILQYHESYGSQVRNVHWREQFKGKNYRAALKVGADIKNISGATLSSVHVTAGVRRIVQTYEALKSSL